MVSILGCTLCVVLFTRSHWPEAVFLEETKGRDFWDILDAKLAKIREIAGKESDPTLADKKVTKYVMYLLP